MMRQTIMPLIEGQRLYAGCGKSNLSSGGCMRALHIENQMRAMLLTIDCDINVQAVQQAAARQAGLAAEQVLVHVTGCMKAQTEAVLAATKDVVRQAMESCCPVQMATVRDAHFFDGKDIDPVLTMLCFQRMDGTPLALLINLACDAARLADEMERLLPSQMVMILPSATREKKASAELAQTLVDRSQHAVNPVWTPGVYAATVRLKNEECGGILYIGRTMIFSFRTPLTAEDVLTLRQAFPNDRMLCTCWDAENGQTLGSAARCREAIEEMKRLVPIAWALPKAFEDAVERKIFEVAYDNQSAGQVMDIWLPDEACSAPYPVIVYAHGGGWSHGWQRGNDLIPVLSGLDRGYAVVSIQYRLSGEARFPAALYDIKAVLRWLRAHAEEYQLDVKKLCLWGASAGAWLVAMAALTAENPALEDVTHGICAPLAPAPRAVVSWCGPYDMVPTTSANSMEEEQREAMLPFSTFLGAPVSRVPQLCRLASPITHIGKHAPPFLLLHGTGDELVPHSQSEKMYATLRNAPGRRALDKLVLESDRPHHGDSWYHEPRVCKLCLDYLDSFCR